MRANSSLWFIEMSKKGYIRQHYGLEQRSIFQCAFSKLILALKVSQVVHVDCLADWITGWLTDRQLDRQAESWTDR